MSQVHHFNKAEIIDVYRAYSRGLVSYYRLFEGNNATPADAFQVADNFFTTSSRNSDKIILAVSGEIQRYISYYNVKPNHLVDEFKLIYFTGMRLRAFLDRDGYAREGQIVLYGMVLMLDERLKKFTNGEGRPDLKERLIKIIREHQVEVRLGQDGIYMIYKCASKMLDDHTEI